LLTDRLGVQFWGPIQIFLPSFMSFSKRPGNQSTDLFMPQGKRSQDGKHSFDVTDDLEHATSLSYTSHIPLNRDPNPAQSTTSILPKHAEDPSQTQADREGDPPQVYFESHSQGHNPRSSSWDLLGGARKFGQAYEQFDPRNASEQHLVFADGDLPNSKVGHHFLMHMAPDTQALPLSVCSLLPISSERINRDTMGFVHRPCIGHHLDPRDSRPHGVPERRGSILAFVQASRKYLNFFLQIWGVRLIWWSIWLSVAWGGTIIYYFVRFQSHGVQFS
jgi:hypothetical protein